MPAPRPHRSAPTALTLVAVVTALALSACGGSSTVSPRQYVTAVCKAVRQFATAAGPVAAALRSSTTTSPTAAKTEIASALDQLSAATHRTLSAVRQAGTPDIKDGQKVERLLVSRLGQIDTTLSNLAGRAKTLPTSSRTAFAQAAVQLGTDVSSAGSTLQSGLSGNFASSLNGVAAKVQACQGI